MRNIKKRIDSVALDSRYCMYASEMKYLVENYTNRYSLIDKVFRYGYALGQRACKKGGK